MRALRLALGHPGLRLLLGAGLVSLVGDWVLRVGLAYYVYALTGSTLASALMLLASFVPQIALGSFAGVFADRWDAQRTMVVANLALAAGLLPLLAVQRADQVWVVYAVLAWEGCVQQFFLPAEQVLLPRLVEGEHLVTANALNGQNMHLARLVGSALGGVAAAGGIQVVALADLVTFLVSAALIARIAEGPRESREITGRRSLGRRLAELRAEWTTGVRLVARHPRLRVIAGFLLITSIGEGIMGTLFAPFVRSVLHGSGATYGLIVSVQAIGGVAGSVVAAAVGDRLKPVVALGTASVAFGLVDLVLFLYPLRWAATWPAVACMIAAGLPGALMFAAAMTLLQTSTSDGQRGRVFGALNAVEGVATVGGILAAGLLGQALGIVPVLVTQGVGYVVAGALVLVALRGRPEPPERPDVTLRDSVTREG